jgi:hypothetical protein
VPLKKKIWRVKQLGHEVDHSLSFNVEAKNVWGFLCDVVLN